MRARHLFDVVVVGGGPAGMEAAIVAGKRGHRVTLLEKEAKLGGQLNIAALPPFKGDIVPWQKAATILRDTAFRNFSGQVLRELLFLTR